MHILMILLSLFVYQAHADTSLQLRIASVDVRTEEHMVEIAVLSGSGSVADYLMTDLDGTDTVLADSPVSVVSGDLIRVHWDEQGIDETDMSGDNNRDGVIDLYSADTNFSTTDDQAVLLIGTRLVDAVIWTNADGAMSNTEQNDFAYLVTNGMWQGSSMQTNAVTLGDETTWLVRTDTIIDTNTASDWRAVPHETAVMQDAEESLPDGVTTEPGPEIAPADVIEISEILPNPVGSDEDGEFIEIVNTSSDTVQLTGWELSDVGGTSFDLDDEVLEPEEIRAIPRSDSGIALNNDSEAVTLVVLSQPVMTVSYNETIPEGVSLVLDNDELRVTATPTPGSENIITAIPRESPVSLFTQTHVYESDDDGEGANEDNGFLIDAQPDSVPLSALNTYADEHLVRVFGVVTAAPGQLGSGIAYIGSERHGVQVYCQKYPLPDVEIGDFVEVAGVLGTVRGERRIRCIDSDVMEISELPVTMSISTIRSGSPALIGSVVRVTDTLTQSNGNTFYLGSDLLKVVIKESTGVQKPQMKKGDNVTIIGILSVVDDTYRVLPRTASDISVQRAAAATEQDIANGAVLPTEYFTQADAYDGMQEDDAQDSNTQVGSNSYDDDSHSASLNALPTISPGSLLSSPYFWIGCAVLCAAAAIAVRWHAVRNSPSKAQETTIPVQRIPDGDLFD